MGFYMEIIKDPKQIQDLTMQLRCSDKVISLVPTMGYFHEGHLSLMRWARENSDIVFVSLFVNPTQFGPKEDFNRYPRDFDRDKNLAEEVGVDYLFVPEKNDMYTEDHCTWVNSPKLSQYLCGKSRPGHFQGVCTIVLKLFNIINPHIAVFGEKDYQQLVIIKKMVEDFNIPVKVVGRPIVREPDGLAMSSRNVYLTEKERKEAAQIYKGLQKAQKWVKKGLVDSESIISKLTECYMENIPSGEIDYIEIVDPEKLKPVQEIKDRALLAVAIYLGKARLIDNIMLEVKK